MPPLVSVIMPTYNRAEYLKEAVESILKQTLQDFELIIIDDASTDATFDVLKSFINDSRVRLYRELHNQGQTVLRNKGLTFASGKFIAWADSDDICLPNRLEKQIAFLDANPDIGVCGTAIEYIGSKSGRVILPTNDEVIRTALLFNSTFANPTVIMRQNLFTENLLYDERFLFAEDYELWVRTASMTRFANLSEVLVRYRVHSQQASSQLFDKQTFYLRQIWERQLNTLGINPTEDEWRSHETIALLAPEPLSALSLIRVHQWLLKLWHANQIYQLYPQSALTHVTTARWISVCRRSGWVGAQMLTRFATSPIGNVIGLARVVGRRINAH